MIVTSQGARLRGRPQGPRARASSSLAFVFVDNLVVALLDVLVAAGLVAVTAARGLLLLLRLLVYGFGQLVRGLHEGVGLSLNSGLVVAFEGGSQLGRGALDLRLRGGIDPITHVAQ